MHVPQPGGGLSGLHVKLLLQTHILLFPAGQSVLAVTVGAFFICSAENLLGAEALELSAAAEAA